MVSVADTDREIAKRIPSNGAVSTASMEYLVQQIPAERITGKLAAMLEAKTPQGNPDWRAQSDAVKLWLSYVIGLPVQRQEIVQHRINTSPLDSLLATAEDRDALRRQLDAMDRQAEGKVIAQDKGA